MALTRSTLYKGWLIPPTSIFVVGLTFSSLRLIPTQPLDRTNSQRIHYSQGFKANHGLELANPYTGSNVLMPSTGDVVPAIKSIPFGNIHSGEVKPLRQPN